MFFNFLWTQKKCHIFHSNKNKKGNQDGEIQCMPLEKWLEKLWYVFFSHLKEWIKATSADMAGYPPLINTRVRKATYQEVCIIGFHSNPVYITGFNFIFNEKTLQQYT